MDSVKALVGAFNKGKGALWKLREPFLTALLVRGNRPAPVSWRQLGGELGASPGPVPGNHKHVSRSMSRSWKHDQHRMETIQQWTWAWDAPSSHYCTLADVNCGTGFIFILWRWHIKITWLWIMPSPARQTKSEQKARDLCLVLDWSDVNGGWQARQQGSTQYNTHLRSENWLWLMLRQKLETFLIWQGSQQLYISHFTFDIYIYSKGQCADCRM